MFKQKVKVRSTIQTIIHKKALLMLSVLILSGLFFNSAAASMQKNDHWAPASRGNRVVSASLVNRVPRLTIGINFSSISKISEKNKFAQQFVRVLSKVANRIIISTENLDLFRSVRRNGKKILFLLVCGVIIFVSLSFYRRRYEGKRFMTTTRLSIMDKEVQRACRYIEEHFDDPELGLASISTALVTGEAFLEALFEKELGLTLAGFINQVRINRIKIMLRRTPHLDARTLAHAAGYHDDKQMTEMFKEVTGCDFTAYGKSLAESGR